MESCVGDNTRIEVITEGILTRQLQRDPGLESSAWSSLTNSTSATWIRICAWRFHFMVASYFERDLRLKLLVMSATLDGEAVATCWVMHQ